MAGGWLYQAMFAIYSYFQIQTTDGTPYWDKKSKRTAFRLHIMWDIPSFHYCATTPNIASVGLYAHKLAEHSNTWLHPDQKGYYKHQQKKVKEFVHHKRLLAKVVIGSGCLPRVKLQFASNQVTINNSVNLQQVT